MISHAFRGISQVQFGRSHRAFFSRSHLTPSHTDLTCERVVRWLRRVLWRVASDRLLLSGLHQCTSGRPKIRKPRLGRGRRRGRRVGEGGGRGRKRVKSEKEGGQNGLRLHAHSQARKIAVRYPFIFITHGVLIILGGVAGCDLSGLLVESLMLVTPFCAWIKSPVRCHVDKFAPLTRPLISLWKYGLTCVHPHSTVRAVPGAFYPLFVWVVLGTWQVPRPPAFSSLLK